MIDARECMRSTMAAWQNGELHMAFSAWHLRAGEASEGRRALLVAAQEWMEGGARKAFASWAEIGERRLRMLLAMNGIVEARCRMCFSQWACAAAAVVEWRAHARGALHSLTSPSERRARHAFNSLSVHASQRRSMRRAVSTLWSRTFVRAYITWIELCVIRRPNSDPMRPAMCRR